jgi:hypothetical protein
MLARFDHRRFVRFIRVWEPAFYPYNPGRKALYLAGISKYRDIEKVVSLNHC